MNIMVLYAYVCVCIFLLHQKSPDRILRDKPLLFQGFYHTLSLGVWSDTNRKKESLSLQFV
jgi:hypothetical protein